MKTHLSRLFVVISALTLVVANLYYLPKVFASTLTNTTVVETNGTSPGAPMIEGDYNTIELLFTTSSSGAVTAPTITVNFQSAWTSASGNIGTSGSQTVSTAGCVAFFSPQPSGTVNTLPGATLTPGGTTTTLTVASSGAGDSLVASTTYCVAFTYNKAVQNPTSTGSYSVIVSVSGSGDTQTVALDILASGANVYTVNAQIAPTFTMSISPLSDSFSGNLSSSAATETNSNVTTTINTNAKAGWIVWVEDANGALDSASSGHNIPSVATGATFDFSTHTGADDYGLGIAPGGSVTAAANYVYTGGSCTATHFCGSGLSASTYFEVAYATAAASNETFVSHEIADILASDPPGTDYDDTITEIGAGSF